MGRQGLVKSRFLGTLPRYTSTIAATGLPESETPGEYIHTWTEHASKDANTIFRTGKWNPDEDALLHDSFLSCLSDVGISAERITDFLSTPKDFPEAKGVWLQIAKPFKYRTLRAIKRRAERLFDSRNKQGSFSPEDIRRLAELVELEGRSWSSIGKKLFRTPHACAVAFENHLKYAHLDTLAKNKRFDAKESIIFLELVKHYSRKGDYSAIPWGKVASYVNRTRPQVWSRWSQNYGPVFFDALNWSKSEDKALLNILKNIGSIKCEDIDWKHVAKEYKNFVNDTDNRQRSTESITARFVILCEYLKLLLSRNGKLNRNVDSSEDNYNMRSGQMKQVFLNHDLSDVLRQMYDLDVISYEKDCDLSYARLKQQKKSGRNSSSNLDDYEESEDDLLDSSRHEPKSTKKSSDDLRSSKKKEKVEGSTSLSPPTFSSLGSNGDTILPVDTQNSNTDTLTQSSHNVVKPKKRRSSDFETIVEGAPSVVVTSDNQSNSEDVSELKRSRKSSHDMSNSSLYNEASDSDSTIDLAPLVASLEKGQPKSHKSKKDKKDKKEKKEKSDKKMKK